MDGENNGKPYEQMDDLGGKPIIFGNIHIARLLPSTLWLNLKSHHGAGLVAFRHNVFAQTNLGVWETKKGHFRSEEFKKRN